MAVLLQVDFPQQEPFGQAMAEAFAGLAQSITQEPGFIWKIWTEDAGARQAGGVYLFRDRDSAERYLAMHTARLQEFGYQDIRGRVFEINEPLTAITAGPVSG
ncbi:MAG: monooxygenase [Pseudomonadota bacterium]|nr:monooxygenase [Pseudomonadota bacterium]